MSFSDFWNLDTVEFLILMFLFCSVIVMLFERCVWECLYDKICGRVANQAVRLRTPKLCHDKICVETHGAHFCRVKLSALLK